MAQMMKMAEDEDGQDDDGDGDGDDDDDDDDDDDFLCNFSQIRALSLEKMAKNCEKSFFYDFIK